MREADQVGGLIDVIAVRTRAAEERVERTREALVPLERRHASAQRSVRAESERLQSIRDHIASPEVSSSAALYADASASRDLAVRDLSRERFIEQKSNEALENARREHEEARAELARLRSRTNALRERLDVLAVERRVRGERVEELEVEEFATTRHACG